MSIFKKARLTNSKTGFKQFQLKIIESLTLPDCRAVSQRWYFPRHRVGHRPLREEILSLSFFFHLSSFQNLRLICANMLKVVLTWISLKYVQIKDFVQTSGWGGSSEMQRLWRLFLSPKGWNVFYNGCRKLFLHWHHTWKAKNNISTPNSKYLLHFFTNQIVTKDLKASAHLFLLSALSFRLWTFSWVEF